MLRVVCMVGLVLDGRFLWSSKSHGRCNWFFGIVVHDGGDILGGPSLFKPCHFHPPCNG